MRRGAQTLAVVGFVASVAIGASGCQTIFSAQQSPATVPAGLAVPSGHSNIVVKRPGGGLGGLLGSIGVHFPANPSTATSPVLPPPAATGALNGAVSQADLATTVCSASWLPPKPSLSFEHKFETLELGGGGTLTAGGTSYHVPGLNEKDPVPAQFRVDHLVPVALGGSATNPRNLWVQPLEAPAGQAPAGMGAQTKLLVDHYLHRLVCSGKLPLSLAQAGIEADWAQFASAAVRSAS